jgi:hypothetical protein
VVVAVRPDRLNIMYDLYVCTISLNPKYIEIYIEIQVRMKEKGRRKRKKQKSLSLYIYINSNECTVPGISVVYV